MGPHTTQQAAVPCEPCGREGQIFDELSRCLRCDGQRVVRGALGDGGGV